MDVGDWLSNEGDARDEASATYRRVGKAWGSMMVLEDRFQMVEVVDYLDCDLSGVWGCGSYWEAPMVKNALADCRSRLEQRGMNANLDVEGNATNRRKVHDLRGVPSAISTC